MTATIFDADLNTADSTRKSRHTGHSPVCFLLHRLKSGYVRSPNAVLNRVVPLKSEIADRSP
ncbi:MAG: hypothetical protein DWI21_06355 [Planctomycetota bacterium]|nr:MAG: hypothetical protein DWI21_06355 [Planctomycetota bacterium]